MPILQHVFKKKDNQPNRPQEQKRRLDREEAKKNRDENINRTKKKTPAQKEESKAASSIKKEHAHTAYNIIVSPHISEKSVSQNTDGKYVFEVFTGANKKQIAQAVSALYGVEVEKVNKISVPDKARRYRRTMGRTSRNDKAIVTLKKGQEIEVLPQ
ncbi:MAG: 50S ribosomal protein L23 [Candidatus Spechtbacterales bacterium]